MIGEISEIDEISESVSESVLKSEYITDFICTYQYITAYNESFILYQLQILQAFSLKSFEDDKINTITEKLYKKFQDNEYILAIIDESNMEDELTIWEMDNLTRFRLCFGYDTFHLMHSLLCSLINNTKVNEDNYNKLINKK